MPHRWWRRRLGTIAVNTPASARQPLLSRIPRVWLVAGGGWAGRLIQIASQFAAVRIMTDEMGTAIYSVFAVLASLVNWFALSDFSIGFSLQNHISERRVAGDDADDLAFTAIVLTAIITFGTALLLLVLGPILSHFLLAEFTFLSPEERTLAFWAMAYPAIGTALGNIAYKIWFAQHRGYLASLFPAAGTVLGTLGIWGLAHTMRQPSLAWTTFAYYVPVALLPLAALAVMAWRIGQHHHFRPRLVRPLLTRAGRFWVVGMLGAAVLQVDYIIMAQALGPADIVVYNVASKVFALILFVYSALLLALWPVCAEAIARRGWDVVMRLVRRYILLGTGFTLIAGLSFLMVQGQVMRVLAPSTSLHIPAIVILLLTVYNIVRVWTDTFNMVLQSMNDLTIFWIVVPFQSILSIALQITGVRWFGLPGMIAGLIFCFVSTVAWILPLRCIGHARAARANAGSPA